MKKQYLKLGALAVFVLALSGAALAQDFTPKVRATIPFNFYAGSTRLPAGNYTLAINRQTNNVAIFQTGTSVGTFLLGSHDDGSRDGRSVLIFRTNGEGTYVLQNIESRDLGVSFPADTLLSHLALDRPGNETRVVIAAIGN
jgi:hypothetical protein